MVYDELKTRLYATTEYGEYDESYVKALDNHAPMKSKTLRANHAPYMTKALRKAIMRRSDLEGKYLKNSNSENRGLYRKQKKLLQ